MHSSELYRSWQANRAASKFVSLFIHGVFAQPVPHPVCIPPIRRWRENQSSWYFAANDGNSRAHQIVKLRNAAVPVIIRVGFVPQFPVLDVILNAMPRRGAVSDQSSHKCIERLTAV